VYTFQINHKTKSCFYLFIFVIFICGSIPSRVIPKTWNW